MSGRLTLNTSNLGENHRYSFLATPLEMHAGHQDDQSSLPVESNTYANDPRPATESPEARSTAVYGESQQAQDHHNSVTSPCPSPPPPEAHPANYAPYAEQMEPQEKHYTAQVPQYSYAPPNSPGPLPAKVNPETLDTTRNGYQVAVNPDENPLHSPRLPRSPSPVAVTTPQVAVPSDLATYHQPGQIAHPNQGIKGGTWSHGLCDCSGIGACCLGLLCPCVLYGRTQHRLSMKSRKEDPTNMLGHDTCNGPCTAMAVLCGCQWLMATIQHTRTRKAYEIRGDIASDCVRATCCTCCTLVQDEKEILKREEERGRAVRMSGAAFEPYMTPGAMSYPPPPRAQDRL